MYPSLFSSLIKSGARFDNDEATGQSGQTGQTQIPDTGGEQQGGESNRENIVDSYETLWDNPEDKDGSNDTSGQQPPQASPVAKSPTNQEVFDEHISSLNLLKDVSLEKITTDLNAGSTESLEKAFKSLASNVYSSALINTNKIMDQKIAKAVEQAVEQSKTSFGSDFALQQMNSQLPFTAKSAIAPMAKQVLEQFIKKGKSTEEAIAGVKDYFKQTASIFAKEAGLVIAPKNRPGGGRFSETPLPNASTDNGDEDPLPDFLKILGGEQEDA